MYGLSAVTAPAQLTMMDAHAAFFSWKGLDDMDAPTRELVERNWERNTSPMPPATDAAPDAMDFCSAADKLSCLSPAAWNPPSPFQPEQPMPACYSPQMTEDQVDGLRVQQQQQQAIPSPLQPSQPDNDELELISQLLFGTQVSNSNDCGNYDETLFSPSPSSCGPHSPQMNFQPTADQQQQQHSPVAPFRRQPRGSVSSVASSGYESEVEIPSPQSSCNDDDADVGVPNWADGIPAAVAAAETRPKTPAKNSNRRRMSRRRSTPTSDVDGLAIRASTPTPHVDKAKITVWLAKLLGSSHHNPRVLSWVDRANGVFRVNDQFELARLWGSAKNNPQMNYEKFSRAMRYYYRRNELVVVRKKLVYQFGSRAAVMREH